MEQRKSGPKAPRNATQTRERMLTAARELFVRNGYGATTLKEVADRAGVAVQTIYFTFGNKRVLLKELVDVAIAGDLAPVATLDRPWFREALAAPAAEAQLRLHVRGTRGILERVAPIVEMLRAAAAADPALAAQWDDDVDPRFAVHLEAARSLVTKPGVRAGMTAGHAADVLFGLLSPELYQVFVRDRGWPAERWEGWVGDTLVAQLCAPGLQG
ncbi:TetR/AcrR family transcriptional regulator [Amycolatopsis sp. cmx-4-61]|uniref:TetR/AcrR family transcriptional regulator n=1 Tax=Amycolatopsis sp. cmx-4-61 TaxID=2790937 RepID=UPI00397D49C1